MPVMEDYLTVEEVADKLRVSIETVRRYIKRKQLIAYKVGGFYRIAPADLQTFLQTRRTSSSEKS